MESSEGKFNKISTGQLKEELKDALKDFPVHRGANESFQERFLGLKQTLDLADEISKRPDATPEDKRNIIGGLGNVEKELEILKNLGRLTLETVEREEARLKIIKDELEALG